MNFAKAALLFLLPAIAAADPTWEECEDFKLTINSVSFMWKEPFTNGKKNPDTAFIDGNLIQWSKEKDTTKSGLLAMEDGTALPYMAMPGEEFPLASITHINQNIYPNTQVDSVTLCATVDTDIGVFDFHYEIGVDETFNHKDEVGKRYDGICPYNATDGTPLDENCSDQVAIKPLSMTPMETFTVNNMTFEFDLRGFKLKNSDGNFIGQKIVPDIISDEKGNTTAYLMGSLMLTLCPKEIWTMGDPHFKTWNGNWYDFQGGCDMHLVSAPQFETDAPLTIDIRTQVRDWYSFIETAAIKLGDDVLEVSGYGAYSFNGVEHASVRKMVMAGKYPVSYKALSKKSHEFDIDLGQGEHIIVHTFKDLVSVKINNAHIDRFEDSVGMMGNFLTGQVFARDGKTTLEDPEEMAREWQVRDDEPMLFQAAHGPQYPQKCVMPKKQQIRLGVTKKAAEEACAGSSPETMDLCVEDVMKTGDVELAEAERA